MISVQNEFEMMRRQKSRHILATADQSRERAGFSSYKFCQFFPVLSVQ